MTALADNSVSSSARVLVISDALEFSADARSDPAWKMAETLSLSHDVVLAVPQVSKTSHPRFAVVYYNRRNIGLLVRDSDVVILSRTVLKENLFLAESGSLGAAFPDSLSAGAFAGRPIEGPANARPGELLVLRPLTRKSRRPGLRNYLARLSHRLRRRAHKWKPFH